MRRRPVFHPPSLGGTVPSGASLPAVVTVGDTTWKTSIFGESSPGSYVLPLKVDVRKAEGIGEGDTIAYVLEVTV